MDAGHFLGSQGARGHGATGTGTRHSVADASIPAELKKYLSTSRRNTMAPTHAEYAKINIACKALGLDKYSLLEDRYGLETSKDLSRVQTADLLHHFSTLGWRPTRAHGKKMGKCSPRYADPQMRKVVAMWITLAAAGVVKNSADYAMQSFVKRVTKKNNLSWCDGVELNNLVESLKEWGTRKGVHFD